MTVTVVINGLFYLLLSAVGILAALPTDIQSVFPPQNRPYIIGALTVAGWVKSNRNLFINPDGTPAFLSWVKDTTPKV